MISKERLAFFARVGIWVGKLLPRRTSKKEKEDPKSKWGKYDVVLTVIKDRLLGKADFQMGLWYDLTSRRFYTDYEEYDAQFAWDDNVYSSKLPYVDRSAVDEFPDK